MKRIPYEELSIAKTDTINTLLLSTPWVELDVEYEDEHTCVVEQALAWAASKPADRPYSPDVNNVLSFVDGFPLFYVEPRTDLADEALPPLDALSAARDVEDFLASVNSTNLAGGDETFSAIWDEQLVLRLSRIGSSASRNTEDARYDPLAAFLLIQRMRLKSELLSSKEDGTKLLTLLESMLKSEDSRFYDAMCRIIAQNYFISLRSQEAIHPALQRNKTNSVLSEYLVSERHHDRLLMDSMQKLGVEYSPSMILAETENIIRVLTLAATNHFFSFCCMIDSFEGEIYEEEDVFASLIKRSNKPQAAAGLDTHFQINVNEEHFDVGRQLCLTMGALPEKEILTAVRLTKACTSLRARMIQQLFNVISHPSL